MKTPFVLAAALLGTSMCFAQTGNPPTEKQMHDNAQAQERLGQGMHVKRDQREYFKSLDRNQKGYLDQDDISADPLLTQNFAKCDSDHNGRLTYAEFTSCTRNSPPPAQSQ